MSYSVVLLQGRNNEYYKNPEGRHALIDELDTFWNSIDVTHVDFWTAETQGSISYLQIYVLQWNLHSRGEHWWCFHGAKLFIFFSRATACGCSSASHARLCEPVGAGLTGKVSSPLALNVKLYAGNQLLICNKQSNPSALIQGLYESLLTGEAWKTWFIPRPVVACCSEPDLASHPQQKSQTRAGLCCWKGTVWFYHLNNPGSRSYKVKLSLLSNFFFSPLLI